MAKTLKKKTSKTPARKKERVAAISGMPIGTIVNYAGDISQKENLAALNDQGWVVCDGASYKQSEYPELFSAILTSNGGDAQNFNVPDLRNRFVRGTSPKATDIDPDASNRIAAAPGGNTGAKTGSLQKSATALPKEPWILEKDDEHKHTCTHLNSATNAAWEGPFEASTGVKESTTDYGGEHFHDISGFDPATLPVNLALHFIIKAREPKSANGITLAATIIGFGGPAPAEIILWIRCDGAEYKTKILEKIFDITAYSFGEPGKGLFNVPDLRGYFLRATDHVSGRDPNFETRHALRAGGNTRDNVGSAQFFATGLPAALTTSLSGNHSHNVDSVPSNEMRAIWGASGSSSRDVNVWTNDETETSTAPKHTHTVVGGDNETRPENVYVDFFMAEDDLPSAPPIGTVISYGGDISDPDIRDMIIKNGWLPCDGYQARRSSYEELFRIIGITFGAGPDNNNDGLYFTLPDLPGRFIIGAGQAPLGTYLLHSTTGVPVETIKTSTENSHQHSIGKKIPAGINKINTTDIDLSVRIENVNTSKTATSIKGEHSHKFLTSGDRESRPVNVYVDFIIRAK